MEITYQGLRIVLPLDGIIQAEDFTLNASFNNHARISLLLLADEEKIEESIHNLPDGANIEIYEKELLFKGKITSAVMVPYKGLNYLKLKAVSYTCEWGLETVCQSFLNLDATYKQVMDKVLENQTNAEIKDCITQGATIPDFLLQYEETDWDFLIRLASSFQAFLIPDYKADYGRAYFGIPQLKEEIVLSEEEYDTLKDLDTYNRVNLNGDLLQQEILRWNVKTGYTFDLAQKVQFRGISTIVTKIKYSVVKGELCRFYELSREKGCLSVPLKNKNIFGMSIPATVKARSGNCIRAHFHIDKEYDNSPNTKYFTYAIESSSVYCMPELESQVHIYFPSDEEKDAVAVHALRTSGGGSTGGSGGGYAQNPDYKSFSNVNGAELLMTPTDMSVSADKEKITSVVLDTEGNATIKGSEIEIKADQDLSIGTPVGEEGVAVLNLYLEGSKITAQIGEGDVTKIELTEENHIISTFIKLNTSDTTPADPSAETVKSEVTAGDAEVIANANAGLSDQMVAKYEEGRGKILSGVVKALATVGTVVLAVGVTVVGVVVTGATGGFAAPLTAPLMMATYGLAATTLTFAAADITEGMGDVQKSREADFSQSYNFLRDTLFFGNQTAYNIAKAVNDIAFGVVSGKAIAGGFNTILKAVGPIACGSQQAKNLKTAIQVGSNVVSGAVNDYIYNGKVNINNVLFNTGLGILQGQAGSRITAGILGDLANNKAAMAVTGTFVDTGLDWLMSELTGKEFDFWQSLALSAASNVMSSYIPDPVDAVTGEYVIQTTDFILASIPVALKLERTYRSGNQDVSVMGKGWTFPLGSRIYRDTSQRGRIHMITITGHPLLFEREGEKWMNRSLGTARFSLEVDEEQRIFTLSDVVEHTVCMYDSAGYLMEVEYPNQQRIVFSYAEGGLTQITTPLGNYLDVVSKEERILQITDEIGRRIQYRYEGDLLTDIVHTDEGITHYEYDRNGYIASVTDENGVRYLENTFDEKGRILRQEFENGVYQEFEYDDKNRRNTIRFSESGKREIYEYNDQRLTERIIYEDGTYMSYEYSDHNMRTLQVSRTGIKTSWKYDDYDRKICEISPDGLETYFEFDDNHDLVRVWDTEKRETVYEYDRKHNLTSVRERITDKEWKEIFYQYDQMGRRAFIRTGMGNETLYQYEENCAYPSRIVTPKGEEIVYEYDKVGRRMSIRNSYGTVFLSYNSRNLVTKRIDGEGYTNRWFYDRMGNLTNYYPARNWGNQDGGYEYHYDFLGRLVDTVSPEDEHNRLFRNFDGDIIRKIHPVSYQSKHEDGEGTRYEYDWDRNCIRIHYADGGTERRFYDAERNLIKQVMPESYDCALDNGPGYVYAYDRIGRLVSIKDPAGNEIQCYEYDSYGQVIRETDGEGKEILYKYNCLGQMIRQQVSVRRATDTVYYRVKTYSYDQEGNKTEEAYGNEEVKRDTEPAGWSFIRFSYDKNNHLTIVEDEYGAKLRYEYDCLGNRILEEQAIEEGIKRRIQYSYNKNGWRIKKEEEIQGNGQINCAVTKYVYDENGNLTGIMTPGGNEVRRSYDRNGRLTEERIIDKKNGIDRRVCYAYDAAGNLLCETVRGAKGDCLETLYKYDLKDRLTHRITQGGAITHYLYDQNDQLIKEIRPHSYEARTDEKTGTAYSYDCRGNLVRIVNGLGQLVEERAYNLQNLPAVKRDGLGNEIGLGYTLDGQIKDVKIGGKSQTRQLQSYAYNARGQITGIIDGIGEKISYDVDSWGRINAVGFSDGVKEQYEYTLAGQVSRATDGNGNSVEYRFNSFGKVRERIDQLGYVERFQYDEDGNLSLYTDRDGNCVYRTYNVLGNPVYEKATDKNAENAVITTYGYDSLGRLTRAVCGGHSYEYYYNEQGRLREKRCGGKRLISYKYDNAGQMIQMTNPEGVIISYEYDLLGRKRRIYSSGMEVCYEYDCLDRLEQIVYGNGIVTHYQYDDSGNVSSLETKLGEENLLMFQYEYDGNGNRISKAGEQKLVGGESSIIHVNYQYNVRGQLLEERRNGEACRYTYDAAGNRVQKESSEGITSYRYNKKNQLVSEEGNRGKKTFIYNHQGGIITEEGPYGIKEFLYNSKNQQTEVKQEDGQVQWNRYDAENLRCEMKENDKLIQFVYHQGELLYERGEENQTSYYPDGGIEASQTGKEVHYYHQDEQLSTALITNSIGKIENHYQYDSFGKEVEKSEQIFNRIGYTGQQYDAVTEQYYLRARYYNPTLGRFKQEDSYLKDGLNLYTYCHNNPVMYCDPSGYRGKATDYNHIPKSDWPEAIVVINRVTGSPNIPTVKAGFPEWFDNLSSTQLTELYGTQSVKDIIKDKLRGGKGNHEWNMVAYADVFKNNGLTAADIMNNGTPTKGLVFKDIWNPKTQKYISGAHTGTSAGRYAHMELEELLKSSKTYGEYVEKVRKWADKHIEGGSDVLPGYFKKGEELPEHLRQQEMKQKSC